MIGYVKMRNDDRGATLQLRSLVILAQVNTVSRRTGGDQAAMPPSRFTSTSCVFIVFSSADVEPANSPVALSRAMQEKCISFRFDFCATLLGKSVRQHSPRARHPRALALPVAKKLYP